MAHSGKNEGDQQGLFARLIEDKHAATFIVGGLALSGASIYFNGHFGYEQGGIAMCAALVGFALAKDAGISYAFALTGRKGRWIAGAVGAIGFIVSCMAALGASSHGREAMSNPLQAQIDAYDAAVKNEREAESALKLLGGTSLAKAEGELAKVNVDGSIFKRTASCSATEHKNARITAVNREACAPYLAAKAKVDAAREAGSIQAKLDAARAVIAKGKPASADAQASTIARLLKLDGIGTVQAALNVILALAIEIIAPLIWAAYASAMTGNDPKPGKSAPEPVPAPAPTKRPSPALRIVKGGRMSDDEAEAIILADIAKGIHRKQEEYAEVFGKSVATISRLVDRLTTKPNARIAEEWVGTRRLLKAAT